MIRSAPAISGNPLADREIALSLPLPTRQSAKALARALLPSSMVVWRGHQGHDTSDRATSAVALTFDDGPTSLTLEYLRVLDQLGARATFFVVGEACAARPDLLRAIAERGHQLANHGYTHRRFTTLSSKELEDELDRTQALLEQHQSPRRLLVRPPHGALSLRCILGCSLAGFTTVLWSFDSGDSRSDDSGKIERAFTTDTVSSGDIILLHEGQPWTLRALPTIIHALQKAGHELVTVGELLE